MAGRQACRTKFGVLQFVRAIGRVTLGHGRTSVLAERLFLHGLVVCRCAT